MLPPLSSYYIHQSSNSKCCSSCSKIKHTPCMFDWRRLSSFPFVGCSYTFFMKLRRTLRCTRSSRSSSSIACSYLSTNSTRVMNCCANINHSRWYNHRSCLSMSCIAYRRGHISHFIAGSSYPCIGCRLSLRISGTRLCRLRTRSTLDEWGTILLAIYLVF